MLRHLIKTLHAIHRDRIFTQQILIFAAAASLIAVTTGSNMIYLIARSVCEGGRAGVMS